MLGGFKTDSGNIIENLSADAVQATPFAVDAFVCAYASYAGVVLYD